MLCYEIDLQISENCRHFFYFWLCQRGKIYNIGILCVVYRAVFIGAAPPTYIYVRE